MAVEPFAITHRLAWLARTPGCGDLCSDRFGHHAETHEAYGAEQERLASSKAVVVTGVLVIDLARAAVVVEGREVRVSGRPWQLLELLATRIGQTVRYEEIVRTVWGNGWLETPGTAQHSVSVTASRLKTVLGVGASLVVTRIGIGLQLFALPAGDTSSAELLETLRLQPMQSRRELSIKRLQAGGWWSRKYDHCQECKRDDRIYEGRGLCSPCYSKWRRARRRGKTQP